MVVAKIVWLFAYLQTVEGGWTLDRLIKLGADLAVVGALLVAARQLSVATLQLKESRQSERMKRSLDFGRRWNDLQFALLRKPVYEFLETEPDLKAFVDKMDRDPNFKAALRFILNFYEEVGLAFNREEVDRTVIRDFYVAQIEFLYKHSSPFIAHVRAQKGSDRILQEFTNMRERMLHL